MNSYAERTLQLIVFIVLFFFGPVGWVCIYLLWKQWNPQPAAKARQSKAKKVD